jgi:hypothetical protein
MSALPMLQTSRCIALCALLFASFGSLCSGETEPLFYIYHGQPKALTLDSTQIAVRVNSSGASSHTSAVPNSLATRGFSDADVVAQPVPGWMILNARNVLTTSGTRGLLASSAEASSVHALITSLLASGDSTIEFVSPVFRDKAGDPIILTPTLLIGFQKDFSAARQSQLLAAVPEGAEPQKVEFPQPHTQRWQLHSHDGFVALNRANSLAQSPGVAYAELDMIVTGHADLIPTDPLFAQSWGLRNTGQSSGQVGFDMEATSAWDIITGSSSVIVLILDVGVQQDHPDINQVTGQDFTSDAPSNPDGGPFGVYDNHGTWVAGCVSGLINNGLGTVGIAPGVKVASARCYNNGQSNGTFTFQFSWVVDALNWGQSIGARVSNNSNGYGDNVSSAIENAYADTRANGMVHFASAGNDGSGTISYPSSISSVNSVGAANRFGQRSSFSQYGPGLKYLAPGEQIYTTDRTGSAGGVPGDYELVDGTSFASPYAAGIAALILSQNPSYTADQVESVMQNSCRDMGPAGYDTDFGYGIIDAYLAVAPKIISSLSVGAFTGTNFSYQIVTNGSPTTFSASGLPTGLNLNTQTGVISGLPTLSGTYDIIITAVGPNMSASATLHIVISPPSPITLLAKLILPDGILEALIADPVRNRIYGANRNSKNIAVIDLASRSIMQTIAVDGNARGMAISSDGSKLWAAETGATDPGVAVVDLVNLAALPSFTVDHPSYNAPWSCVLTPDRKLLVGQAQFQMTRLDADTGITEDSFSTRMYEPYFALGSDGVTLYSGDMNSSGYIHRFTLVNDKPVETAETIGGAYLCLSPDQKTLYSIDTSNPVSDSTAAFDASTLSEIHSIPNPGDWGLVAVSGDGFHLYRVSHFYDSGKVDAIDTRSNQIVGTLGLNLSTVSQSNNFTDMVLDRTGQYLVLASYSQGTNTQGQLWLFSTGFSSDQSNASPPPPHTFLNISTRTFVQTGDNVEIGGFIINGDQPKKVVLRAIGPSLAAYGLPAVTDPVLDLHDSTGAIVVTNDNWNSHRADVLATGLAPSDEHEAVIVTTLAPGNYTAILHGLNGATGTALFELYDVDPTNSTIANISTRSNVQTGDNVMIGGFIIGGDQPTKVIVRAIGPSLTQSGIGDALLDPVLELHDGSGNLVTQNDDWRSDQEQAITDSGLAPSDDRESAILTTLAPGGYTAIVRGKNNTTGVALVEVYNLEAY